MKTLLSWPVAVVIVSLLLANMAHTVWKDHREGWRVNFVSIVSVIALIITMLALAIAENRQQ